MSNNTVVSCNRGRITARACLKDLNETFSHYSYGNVLWWEVSNLCKFFDKGKRKRDKKGFRNIRKT